MNRTTRHLPTVNGQYYEKVMDVITHKILQRKLKSEKSCKIDLFNCTPKRCEGTEVNTVRKRVPAINHTFTEKNCTHTAHNVYFGA